MPKYDLMFGCLGNGITVCNRAQTEHGDYKIIAHISEGGNVKYYDDKNTLPAEVIESIEKHAADSKQEFQSKFVKQPKGRQYEIILDSLPIGKLLELPKDAYTAGWEKLLSYYFSLA